MLHRKFFLNPIETEGVNTWQLFEKAMSDERYRPIFELLEKVKENPYLINYKAPKLPLEIEDIEIQNEYKHMTKTELENELKKVEAMMKAVQNKIENN